LYLLIDPPKTLGWRYKYRIGGREKPPVISESNPDVPTALARERRDEARKQLATGRDPSVISQGDGARTSEHICQRRQELLVAQKASSSLAPLAENVVA